MYNLNNIVVLALLGFSGISSAAALPADTPVGYETTPDGYGTPKETTKKVDTPPAPSTSCSDKVKTSLSTGYEAVHTYVTITKTIDKTSTGSVVETETVTRPTTYVTGKEETVVTTIPYTERTKTTTVYTETKPTTSVSKTYSLSTIIKTIPIKTTVTGYKTITRSSVVPVVVTKYSTKVSPHSSKRYAWKHTTNAAEADNKSQTQVTGKPMTKTSDILETKLTTKYETFTTQVPVETTKKAKSSKPYTKTKYATEKVCTTVGGDAHPTHY